ncbi:MAG: hypothetical protein HY308_14380 [Gammaproteobacteria bacterium]|nr:hypothetical protein [Gammaproteobacteria bacterium]
MLIYAYSLPAILALIAKVLLLIYSRRSPIRDTRTRLFVVAVFLAMALNALEIFGFLRLTDSYLPTLGDFYHAVVIVFCAVLCHLTVCVAFENPPRWLLMLTYPLAYGFALVLLALLAFPPQLIAGYIWLGGYTITSIPGPFFPLLEMFFALTLLTVLCLPIRGIRLDRNGKLRSRCQIWLLTAVPCVLLVATTLTLLHFDIRWFNTTVTMPIPLALFLAGVGYAIHNHRIIEPGVYFPFSKIKRTKQTLYHTLAALIEDSPKSSSVTQLLKQLADVLQCPVALVSANGGVYSDHGIGADLPAAQLADVQHMVVAGEIRGPLNDLMKQRRLGAIVPLFPHSQTASSWLLFGETFARRMYTPADFARIERVVQQLAGLFLDNLLQTNPTTRRDSMVSPATVPPAHAPGMPAKEIALHPLAERLAHYEAFLIKEALRSCAGNQAQAARLLGLQPNTLHYKLKRLKLEM